MIDKLEIETILSVPFAENTYVLRLTDRDECLVVDPGLQPKKIINFLSSRSLAPAAILLTHGHADHIGGNEALKQLWPDCPIVIGAGDAPLLQDPELNLSAGFGASVVSPPADILLSEGQTYAAAGLAFDILDVPGHSPGHIVYVLKESQPTLVLGGDVLFAGGVGRTDFPGGDFELLKRGIQQKLFALPDDTVVFPGHGEPTTVGVERRTNPFVGEQAIFDDR